MVEVTQADRDAAEAFRRGIGGKYDREVSSLAEAFARHRLAERAAVVAWLRDIDFAHESQRRAVNQIADAIERGDHA